MGLFSSLFGPSPAERAAQEAERKRQEEKRAEEARVARFERSWGELERKYTNKTPITATAKSSTKRRGYEQELVFDLDGVTAYMAISKIALGFVQNINDYVGKPITFRIISMSKYEKSVQVSASIILQEKRQQEEQIRRQQEAQRREAERKQREEAQARYRRGLAQLASKDYIEGTVVSIQDRGITVRLKDTSDGKEVQGWIHISQLANRFVNHPSEVVKVGDAIKACASLKSSGDELELSIREFEEKEDARRKEEVFSRLEEDAIVSGTVKKILPKIVFVDLGGVDASIHISQLSSGFVNDPNEIVRVGDPIEAAVLRINEENGRIELSIKRLKQL